MLGWYRNRFRPPTCLSRGRCGGVWGRSNRNRSNELTSPLPLSLQFIKQEPVRRLPFQPNGWHRTDCGFGSYRGDTFSRVLLFETVIQFIPFDSSVCSGYELFVFCFMLDGVSLTPDEVRVPFTLRFTFRRVTNGFHTLRKIYSRRC